MGAMKARTIFSWITVFCAISFQLPGCFAAPHEKMPERLGYDSVNQIAYSPDGKLLAAGNGTNIRLYNPQDMGEVKLLQGDNNLQLALPESLVLEVQVEDEEKGSKGTQHSLEVELKWYDNDQQAGGGGLTLG